MMRTLILLIRGVTCEERMDARNFNVVKMDRLGDCGGHWDPGPDASWLMFSCFHCWECHWKTAFSCQPLQAWSKLQRELASTQGRGPAPASWTYNASQLQRDLASTRGWRPAPALWTYNASQLQRDLAPTRGRGPAPALWTYNASQLQRDRASTRGWGPAPALWTYNLCSHTAPWAQCLV